MIDITKQTKAVTSWASNDETRPNLCGVWFAYGLQVATNGHGIAMLYEIPTDPEGFPLVNGERASGNEAPALLPVEAVNEVVKGLGKRRTTVPILAHALEVGARNGRVTIANGQTDTVRQITPIDGEYPDVQQVLPDPARVHLRTAVDPGYLKRVGESALSIGAKSVTLEFAGEPPTPLRFTATGENGEELVVVLMPMRF